MALRSTATITWKDVSSASKKAVDTKKKRTGKDDNDKPNIDTMLDAREEADRQNIARLAAIGAKEGVIDAIKEKFGSAITNSVLETSDNTDFKTINQVGIHELPKTVISAVERPVMSNARDEFKVFIATRFDFRSKLVNPVEQLRVQANKAKGCGVLFKDNIIVPVTMANVEWVAGQT